MSEPTKVISVRIPLELYEEILVDLAKSRLTMNEWLFIRIITMNKLIDKKVGFESYLTEIEESLSDGFDIPGLPIVEKIKTFINNIPGKQE